MTEEQSDIVFENAYGLYQEIRDNRGLHLRHGNGRDDVLIEELCKSIGCPDNQIAEFLKEEDRSAEWLIREFLQLAAPFARMFTEIWDFLSSEKASRATEDLRIRFGFEEDDFTDVDLEEFRECAETARKVSVGANVAFWSEETLYDLFDFAESVDVEGQLEGQSYRPYNSYKLPTIETHHNDDFEIIVRRVRDLFQNIIDDAAESTAEGYDRDVLGAENENLETPLSLGVAARLLHDLLGDWEPIFKNHHSVSEEDRRKAVEFFQEKIVPKLEIEGLDIFQNYQTPLDILQLPFWEHRWHTYEIWMTVQTLWALNSCQPQVRNDDGRIPIDGRDTAIVADLEGVKNHDACVVTELQTPYETEEKDAIQPDLSICRTQEMDKESRLAIIEYKQRANLSASHVEEVAELYLSGSPEAVGLVMVNYDDAPDVYLPEAAELIENVRPTSPTVRDYHYLVQEYMKEAELFEPLQQWAVLVDVSGSMGDMYMDREVKNALLNLLGLMGSTSGVYKFNDGLTQNPRISADDVDKGLRSKGGTDVEAAIDELYQEHLNSRNLLVVTDGNYTSPDSLPEELENMKQCSPKDLSSELKKVEEAN